MLSVVLAQHDGRCDDLQQGGERSPPQGPTRAPRIALVRKTTREVSMYSQLKLRPLGGGLFCVAWWSMRDRVARQSGRHPKSRQGLGKDTRIRRCDYPKLTRFVKRIPTCSGHVCCIDLGEESEPHRGSFRRQATTTKVMGTSRGKRLAPLRTDDVANRAQNLAIWFVRKGSRSRRNHNPRWQGSTELLNAEEIERGGHDGDQ
jgi:hypothetical protein